MTDFKDMAAQAKAAYEARVAERAQKSAMENEAKARRAQASADHLRAEVLPILETAKNQFRDVGVDLGDHERIRFAARAQAKNKIPVSESAPTVRSLSA